MGSDLYELEAQLDDRERICLAGYLLMKDNDDKAMMKAYVYSRSYQCRDEFEILRKKAEKWFNSAKVQAFLELWQRQSVLMTSQAAKQVVKEKIEDDENAISATEEIIQRYEQLYSEAESIDDKAKILKMIVDARHKNKDEVKDDSKIVDIYLPLRCSECVLYKREKDSVLL